MNKKQFYRLTLVLTLPFFILSWWLSQQDFILERGQQITCDVESNYCDSVFSFPQRIYAEMNNYGLRYSLHDDESIIILKNFNYPIGPVYFLDYETNEKIIDPDADLSMTSSRLETKGCTISSMHYFCSDSSGKFRFTNIEDAKKFENLINTAKDKLKRSDKIRVGIALAIFLAILLCYFIFSFLIKFIIYGVKKSDK
ncbi:hypothetical protein [Acinetobacter beijerinckii]|uniref:hypothetical protein n=1 Tax=Acinetobacter beijerinckii TaxID=262668 RepID=UPI003AF5B6E7